jgi:hypothetical protein
MKLPKGRQWVWFFLKLPFLAVGWFIIKVFFTSYGKKPDKPIGYWYQDSRGKWKRNIYSYSLKEKKPPASR